MNLYCGIDWAEEHHDVAIVDADGRLVAKTRITDDASGYRTLLELMAEHGDSIENPIPVAIETSHGLLVAALRATGGRSSRSTPWRPLAIENATGSPARSRTPATP